jgi:DNA-binding CsgD family transcriptional regulator
MATLGYGDLDRASLRLGEAVLDPGAWPDVMDEICPAAGATGAVLLQSDARTADVPRTASVEDLVRNYFADSWHVGDLRAVRAVPLLLGGEKVVVDQDLFTREEMDGTAYYQDLILASGFHWFAAVGFRSGPAHWALSIQRTQRDGPFEAEDKRGLARIADRLTESATLSWAVGRSVLAGMTNALSLVRQPALAVDRAGRVLEANAAAEHMFDDELRVKDRRLFVRDRQARAALDVLFDRIRSSPQRAALPAEPIIVKRVDRRPLLIRTLPVDGPASGPFLGARAILTLCDLAPKAGPRPDLVARVFGLTPAEANLASLIGTGVSLERAAQQLGIARETARNQLKAAFAKTDTHRQAELAALLSRL